MKQGVKKYLVGRVVSVVMIVLSVVVLAVYGMVQLFAVPQMKEGSIPHIGSHTYITVTDEQYSEKVSKNALVLGDVRPDYQPGNIVAVALDASNKVTVKPNTCADIAVVQILDASDTTLTVSYADTEHPFYVAKDAVLCRVSYQIEGLGLLLVWMKAPLSFIFWLILPILMIVLCVTVIAYLREKHLRSLMAHHQYVPKESVKKQKKDAGKPTEEVKKSHPLLSGEEVDPVFADLPKDDADPSVHSADANETLAAQIAQKIAAVSMQEQRDRENLNQQLNAAMDASKSKEFQSSRDKGSVPAQPKTTVVYQVGEQKAEVREEPVAVNDDDLDLLMLQDKIETIINNNNRRLENEVESKLRGLSTEKEVKQRELEKTREFFISPEHLLQNRK